MRESQESIRYPSGIPGLDEVLHGGFFAASTYLLAGRAGAGKTIFSLQWLLQGVKHDEHCLFISLGEPSDQIVRNVNSLGWDLAGLDIVDLTPTFEPDDQSGGEYTVMAPAEVEQMPLWQGIYAAVREHKPHRVVIDSATQLRYLSTDEFQFRKHIQTLVHFLNQSQATCLLNFEPTELEKETSLALAVDGILHIRHEISPSRLIGLRSIQVEKFRGSDFMSGLHPVRIGSQGMTLFPHHIASAGTAEPGARLLTSGIDELDTLLDGGIESGTATVVSGPTGVGKTLLGMQFMIKAAQQGERVTVYVFEESAASVKHRIGILGHAIDPLLDDGRLNIVQINPLQVYPDEFLAMVRDEVEAKGCRTLMVDSLRGYDLAMEQFGSIVAHMQNLVYYLGSQNVSSFLINEVEHLTGDLRVTELGVSYLADNVILLRYCEDRGRILKVIACLKKRLGAFQPELRELEINASGMNVGPKLHHLRGVLTGVPIGNGGN